MAITIKDVEHVAKLARLALSEDEKKLYTEQLARIIENFHDLNAVDTTGVEPLAQSLPLVNVLRDDEVQTLVGSEVLLKGAPSREGSFFRVPKIGE